MPFVQSAVDGESVSILAYGQTGSGKTYTMEGPDLATSDSITTTSGILPRAVDFIFREIKRIETMGHKVELSLSCLEIYNEGLTDLLADSSSLNSSLNISLTSQNSDKEGKLQIVYSNNRVFVNNLNWIAINNNQQLFQLVMKASKARATEKTAWNDRYTESTFSTLDPPAVIAYID